MKRALLALVLVVALFSTSAVSAAPTTAAGEYWEDLKAIYEEWEAMEGQQEMKITLNIPEEDPMVFNVNLKSIGNMEDLSSSMEVKITTEDPEFQIPLVHMITHGVDIYLNTEIINFIAEKMDMADAVNIEEEYVMLQGGEEVPQVNKQYLIDVLEFLEGMDLDFEFDITKEDNKYILKVESDQMVDLFDAYMLYVFENINELMEISGQEMEIEISEEEQEEAIAMYLELFAPMLEEAKAAIKGSYYTQETLITDDFLDDESEFYLTTPVGSMTIVMESQTNKIDEYTLELPKSVKVYTEEDLTNLLISSMGLAEEGVKLVAMIDIDEDKYMLFTETELIEGEVEITVTKEGLSYISVNDAVEIFAVELEPSEELMHTRELADYGYEIKWNEQLRMVEIYEAIPEITEDLPVEIQ